jgi:hypothetical protein
MATRDEWAAGYARQAYADFETFGTIQELSIPDCHKLQFLQMACEKLVKAHLCAQGTNPTDLRTSHAYITKTLPVVLRQYTVFVNFTGGKAREAIAHASRLAREIDVLSPSVDRGGRRPDNCEYPWEDAGGTLHVPLDWSFEPSRLIELPAGRIILKLVGGSINRLLLDWEPSHS